MRLISENFVDNVEYITEQDEKTGKKNYKLKGVFMQSEIKNRNGRVYPFEVLDKEVKRYNKEFIEQNRAYGELGHPDFDSKFRQSITYGNIIATRRKKLYW